MEISKNVWSEGTRPCRFSLCLQQGSVFADFDVDPDGSVFLARISFDGYGCCHAADDIARMSLDDSLRLTAFVEGDEVNRSEMRQILRRYFQHVSGVIWRDALQEHGLLD